MPASRCPVNTPGRLLGLAAVGLLVLPGWADSRDARSGDALEAGFANPPLSARPRTWWHWMNGNVTLDGIGKDLEWMQRAGLGGLQNFDASLGTPQIVERRLVYMDDGWKAAFRFAVAKADELGLEVAIAASPGWSETGGPWVPPADGMKKLVWSETLVAGGRPFSGSLAPPPDTTGPYQNAEFHDPLHSFSGPGPTLPRFYRDVAVLAYPVTESALPVPEARIGGESLAPAALLDDDLHTVVSLPAGGDGAPALIYDYGRPVTVRSATLYVPNARPPFGDPVHLPALEAETANGWQPLAELPLTEAATTVSFAAVTARRFRLVMRPNPDVETPGLGEAAPGAEQFDIFAQPPTDSMPVGLWRLSGEPRINRAGAKAGYATVLDYYALATGPGHDGAPVSPGTVENLTSRMAADGRISWTPPAGSQWRILRLGYSLTGKQNHPAPPEATGLEVDKYDGPAVRRYLEHYLGMYRQTTGAALFGDHGLRALLTDSIEVGEANWTPDMPAKFTALRGYDPMPWLPVLTGAVIGTPAQSEAFLYDFRRTLADLLASEHYATVAEVAAENGLIVYGEALEDGRPVIGDDMAMRKHASVPMAAMWMYHRGADLRPTLLGDMKGAASVAHVYGQNVVAAESMTAFFSPWAFAPSDLKRVIDLEFASGVNRPVIHTSVHQPLDDKLPGLSLAVFGQYFNRHETWAEMARPWIDYISRSSFLLQQGRNAADVAFFYGEESPITAQFAKAPPDNLPVRYAYDFVNADVVQNVLSVENGELVAGSGARYRVLFLGGTSRFMTLPTLEGIAALVRKGATVVGRRPQGSPSLADDATRFASLADRLWGADPITHFGRGRVVADDDVEAALGRLDVSPDFEYGEEAGDAEVLFLHRKTDDADLWFVNNRENRDVAIDARFRVTGKRPEIWRAIAGTSQPASYRFDGDRTVVPLVLRPEDAVFVVFRERTTAPSMQVPRATEKVVANIAGPWQVDFQPGRGAPDTIEMPRLEPLDQSDDAGVRYFSGIATYRNAFDLPRGLTDGATLWLDLGRIGDVAQVFVNGKSAGISWFPPHRVDVGALARDGSNRLEVRVANLWVNRLIGDKQPGAEKLTFTVAPTYRADAPLRPSGLMGPVRLVTSETP